MTRQTAFAEYNIEDRSSSLHGSALVGSFADVGPGPHTTVPHRHDFVELIWVTAGSGMHHIDASSFAARRGTLHIIAPGQVHFWEPGATPIEGMLVLFREQLLSGPGGIGRKGWAGGMTRPAAQTSQRIDRLITELHLELEGEAADRDAVVRFLLSALMSVCTRAVQAHARPHHTLPVAFQAIVREHTSATLSVGECARRLNVTPNHLTDVVVADLGRTPGAIIRAEVTLEAQRMLARTELSCAQVAAALDFEDPSYFSRFFRRETGMTPSAYRKFRGTRAA